MPRYIVIKIPDWSGIVAPDVMADDINHMFQPHYDARVVTLDEETSAKIDFSSEDEDQHIQDLLDRDMI